MLSNPLQQKKITLLYFNTESEKVFNLTGKQRNPNQSEMSCFHILSWLKNKPNHQTPLQDYCKTFLIFYKQPKNVNKDSALSL